MDTTNLITICSQQFEKDADLYMVVDFLNRNLKEFDLVVGLSKSDEDKLQITIYQERER
ncbi:MAG: DUF4264 family protein [Tumebacillaceae bacterium]